MAVSHPADAVPSRTMKFLFRAVLLVALALPVLALVAVWLCFQDRPSVVRSVQLTPQDIENARRMIERQGSRTAGAGGRRTIVIGEQDLDLMLNYAASRYGNGAVRVELQSGAARLQASLELPHSPFGRFVNVDATLRETGALPRFDQLRIGSLPVPAALADWLLREGLRRFVATDRGELAADVVKGVRVAEGRLTVTYVWTDAVAERARSVLLSPAELERLRAYHDRLVDAAAAAPARVSLADLLPPLFRLAHERGARGDILRENRAALLVLALYVNGQGLAEIASAARQWPRIAPRRVTLAGRDDFPRHFLISAVIAAEAGSPLADAVGLHKEIGDSRGGSGFSFNDIGADRAGHTVRRGRGRLAPARGRARAGDRRGRPRKRLHARRRRSAGIHAGGRVRAALRRRRQPGLQQGDGDDRRARCVTPAAAVIVAAVAVGAGRVGVRAARALPAKLAGRCRIP